MEQDPSQSLHNSNTISQAAAAKGNPGHLMYSHALYLTQGLSAASYQYPTDLDVRVLRRNPRASF